MWRHEEACVSMSRPSVKTYQREDFCLSPRLAPRQFVLRRGRTVLAFSVLHCAAETSNFPLNTAAVAQSRDGCIPRFHAIRGLSGTPAEDCAMHVSAQLFPLILTADNPHERIPFCLVERNFLHSFFSKMHEYCVDRQTIKPSRKRGITSKR